MPHIPEPPTEFTEFTAYGGMLLIDKTDNIFIHLAQSALRLHIYATTLGTQLTDTQQSRLIQAQQALQELEVLLRPATQEIPHDDNK